MKSAAWWLRLHGAVSVAAAGLLVLIGSEQWFIRDDWIVTRGAGTPIFHALTQHLVATTSGMWQLLYPVFGLDAYWPYLLLAIAAHVVAVHLVTRVAIRSGVPGPAAVAVGLVPLVSPMAADHVLHAVNVGFGLAVALPIGALLILDPNPLEGAPEPPSRARAVVGAGLLLLGMASTSLGLVLALLVGGWLALRGGLRTGVPLIAMTLGVYAIWVALAGDTRGPDPPLAGVAEAWFFLHSLVASTTTTLTQLPLPVAPILVGVLVVAGLVQTVRGATPHAASWGGRLGHLAVRLTPAGMLAALGLVMLVVTSFQRGGSPTLVDSPRYQLMLVVLCLPMLAAGVGAIGGLLVRWLPETLAPLAAGTLLLGGLAVLLPPHVRGLMEIADEQAITEHAFRGRLAAAASLMAVQSVDLDASVDRGFLPGVSFRDLQRVIDGGHFDTSNVTVTEEDALAVEVAATFRVLEPGLTVAPMILFDVYGPPVQLLGGCVEVERENTLVLRVDEAAAVPVAAAGDRPNVTVRVGVGDADTDVRASNSWVMALDGPATWVVPRPRTNLFVRPGFTGRLRICGLVARDGNAS